MQKELAKWPALVPEHLAVFREPRMNFSDIFFLFHIGKKNLQFFILLGPMVLLASLKSIREHHKCQSDRDMR